MTQDMPLLYCTHVTKEFVTQRRILSGNPNIKVTAVDDISLSIRAGETLGIVGESGSGKSTIGEILGGLQKATQGSVYFEGIDILDADKAQRKHYRRNVQFIFQDPKGSMNPHFTIEKVIGEPLVTLDVCKDKAKIKQEVARMIELVGLEADTIEKYPSELSGGQCQRVAIARALAVNPKVIICDEPVSALDVSVQAQILNLLKDLQKEFGIAYLFISHDIGVVNYMADRIIVMNRGSIVETGDAERIFKHPVEDYTKKLVASSFAQ